MNKDNRIIILPILLAAIVTVALEVYAGINGRFSGIKDSLKFFGGTTFFFFVFGMIIRFTREFIEDFFETNFKGKISLLLILIGFILRAFYQMRLSK